jgi:hypothetical protein
MERGRKELKDEQEETKRKRTKEMEKKVRRNVPHCVVAVPVTFREPSLQKTVTASL